MLADHVCAADELQTILGRSKGLLESVS